MIKMKENEQCVMKNVGEFNQHALKYIIFVQFFFFMFFIKHIYNVTKRKVSD